MRKTLLFFSIVVSAIVLFSCASAPAADQVDLATAKGRAGDALAKAKTVNADVAVKADYDMAQTSYKAAQGLEASAEAQAIQGYLECERQALAAHDAALAKREEARRQLDKAKNDIKALEDEDAQITGGR